MSDSRSNCPFCRVEDEPFIAANDLAFARYDGFPVSKGHALIIPRRHIADFFDLTPEEMMAVYELLRRARDLIHDQSGPDGFNIGVNVGRTAGQTVMHVHLHIIPRYSGDVVDPTGGIRNVLPGMGPYSL